MQLSSNEARASNVSNCPGNSNELYGLPPLMDAIAEVQKEPGSVTQTSVATVSLEPTMVTTMSLAAAQTLAPAAGLME